MITILILIQVTVQQKLTHQTLRPQKVNYELISDRIDCKSNQSIIIDICKNCKANHAYRLDEQNWLIIGVYHEFGKEYKELIESIQNYYQQGIIYATFNSEFICFSIQDADVNLEEFLNKMYYYQLPKSFYPLKKRLLNVQKVKLMLDIIQPIIILQSRITYLMDFLKQINTYNKYLISILQYTIIMLPQINQVHSQTVLNQIKSLCIKMLLHLNNQKKNQNQTSIHMDKVFKALQKKIQRLIIKIPLIFKILKTLKKKQQLQSKRKLMLTKKSILYFQVLIELLQLLNQLINQLKQMILKLLFLQWKRLTQISTLINKMKIDKGLKLKHDKIKKSFIQTLTINAQQKRQLKVIQMRNNYKLLKLYLFKWNLAMMRKYRMNEICFFVKNQYRRNLQKKVFRLLNDNSLKRQSKRRKLIKADNYFNNKVLQKSFKSLRINEKSSKQEFLEKRKMIDEKEKQQLTNQKELQNKLMADAFYISKLMMKSFLNWKKYIFYQDKQDYYQCYNNKCIENNTFKLQETIVEKEKEKVNKNEIKQQENWIMLEYKIKFYQKYQDQLTSFQKEILKMEICQLKQLQ